MENILLSEKEIKVIEENRDKERDIAWKEFEESVIEGFQKRREKSLYFNPKNRSYVFFKRERGLWTKNTYVSPEEGEVLPGIRRTGEGLCSCLSEKDVEGLEIASQGVQSLMEIHLRLNKWVSKSEGRKGEYKAIYDASSKFVREAEDYCMG